MRTTPNLQPGDLVGFNQAGQVFGIGPRVEPTHRLISTSGATATIQRLLMTDRGDLGAATTATDLYQQRIVEDNVIWNPDYRNFMETRVNDQMQEMRPRTVGYGTSATDMTADWWKIMETELDKRFPSSIKTKPAKKPEPPQQMDLFEGM